MTPEVIVAALVCGVACIPTVYLLEFVASLIGLAFDMWWRGR